METLLFKQIFGEVARTHGFESAYGIWFKENAECISVLELQKSNYGNYYQLNIKVYVQGVFGRVYKKNKDLINKYGGDILSGEPKEYRPIFDLDNTLLDENERREKLADLFACYIVDFVEKTSTKTGILEMAEKKKVFLTPAINEEINTLLRCK